MGNDLKMTGYPYALGFDTLFNSLRKIAHTQPTPGYPPFNVIKKDDNTYVIDFAIAGFDKSDITITLERGTLRIEGSSDVKVDEDDVVVFQGISNRHFTRSFRLADTVEVKNAEMINGMLRVWLENVIPETEKAKTIEIK